MPVSGVTTGDVITEAWGDSVASSVTDLETDVAALEPDGTAPSTQAFGDAAAAGAATRAARRDHKHAMPADPVTAHVAAGDPHTGYRLESADHSHASTGLQGGTVAHSALTGLTSGDPHTQYRLETDSPKYTAASSAPGSPTSGDRWLDTDTNIEYFYDGTRWLSVQLFTAVYHPDHPATATESIHLGVVYPEVGDKWLEAVEMEFRVRSGGTALGASHKWDVSLTKSGTGGSTSLGVSFAIDSGSSNVYRVATPATVAALLGATYAAFVVTVTKTGTPGNFDYMPCVRYRLVG